MPARSCRTGAMVATPEELKCRILILAPIGRDAAAAAHHLGESKLACVICADLNDLNRRLGEGAAAAIVTEEALLAGTQTLEKWVASQPAWSDFPLIILTSRHSSHAAQAYRLRLVENLGNVSLLERPLNVVTLMSAVRSALRARRHQYEVQHHLLERETSAALLEGL